MSLPEIGRRNKALEAVEVGCVGGRPVSYVGLRGCSGWEVEGCTSGEGEGLSWQRRRMRQVIGRGSQGPDGEVQPGGRGPRVSPSPRLEALSAEARAVRELELRTLSEASRTHPAL